MADLVRGAIVPPGETFSINEHVGQRTAEKGFVLAGAIANGEHVEEIGGGVSQFATTTFNAAFFAGLPFGEYQSHSECFDRYPRGREATMGFPHPDLQIKNDTPYGDHGLDELHRDQHHRDPVLDPVRLRAADRADARRRQGNCTRVTTTRTGSPTPTAARRGHRRGPLPQRRRHQLLTGHRLRRPTDRWATCTSSTG